MIANDKTACPKVDDEKSSEEEESEWEKVEVDQDDMAEMDGYVRI